MFTKVAVDHSLFAAAPLRIPNIPPWSLQKPLVDFALFWSHLHNTYDQCVNSSGRIYTIHMTSVLKSTQMEQKTLLEPAAVYT